MMISPVIATIIVAIIVILAMGCLCFGIAWAKAEEENAELRSKRLIRAVSATQTGELG